jgi:pimeloyl-ACP methyl ester carboxylesterase/putative sterol carrier protein
MPAGVIGSIEDLPDRFRPERASTLDARFRLRIRRAVRDVVISNGTCRVERTTGVPDVEISTDPATWRQMNEGRLSGIEAFADHRLVVRGSIETSLLFEPAFERPLAGGLRYSVEQVAFDDIHVSALVADDARADPLVLVHGLGATKSSWLTAVPNLARRFRVVALDLPGFGASSKPRGRYDAPWFALQVFSFLDAAGIEKAFVGGNSMGGRVAMEMAMVKPERVHAIACLSPAAAFSRRPALALVRLARPELGWVVSRLPRGRIKNMLRSLFADPTRLEEAWYDAAVDDFLRIWRAPRARTAFFSAARHIYLDEPSGEAGFWARLAQMKPPALYIYGERDVLITPRFGARIRRALPNAEVQIWEDCGHVPQIEHPARAATAMTDFFERAKKPATQAV